MATNKQSVLTAALVGAMSPEADITPPSRARSASFSSTISDLKVGETPAAKVMLLDANMSIGDTIANLSELSDKFRNNVQSSVSQAKRRLPGTEYSIEISDIKLKSGMYLLALVHRTA